jgi:5-hydroxyisourate hydrolase-like protein (transthyretin family)
LFTKINWFGSNSITVFVLALLLIASAHGGVFNSAYAASSSNSTKQLKVKVSFSDDPIKRGNTQEIKVRVTDQKTQDPVSNALVKFRVDFADGSTTETAKGDTNNDGRITFKEKIESGLKTGTFDVTIKASKNGYKDTTVHTSFEVIGSSHSNNNNNDNYNNHKKYNNHSHDRDNNYNHDKYNNNSHDKYNNNSHDKYNNNNGNDKNNNSHNRNNNYNHDKYNNNNGNDKNSNNNGNDNGNDDKNNNDNNNNDNSVHQTLAQACVNQNAPCQNIGSQITGSDNAVNVIGNQP